MFVRETTARGHRYLYLVESVREGKRVRQRTIRALGRKDVLQASGELDRLIASLARHSERAVVLSDMEAGHVACMRIGGPLLFGRLWDRLGLGAVVKELLDGRGFGFAVERAVFVSVLHRLFVSGSDRSCEKWMADYAIDGIEGLRLHQLYRAMAWLGEELEAPAEGALAPRCVKDAVEERLFERRRDLFTDLSLVFMDTTTLSFHGAGGETLGAHGYSKDHRPDLRQMVLAVVLDGEGRPCVHGDAAGQHGRHQGAAADHGPFAVTLRDRSRVRGGGPGDDLGGDDSGAGRAGAGLHPGRARAAHEGGPRGGAEGHEALCAAAPQASARRDAAVREGSRGGRRALHRVPQRGGGTEGPRRPAGRGGRPAEAAWRTGEKALIGNSAYRRYLRRTGAGKAFEIDAGKLAEEARFDGIFVLRTNAGMTPLNAVLRYRELLTVEDLFRRAKAQLRTRPIYHSCDAAIRGHVFCSFLALVLQKELADRCAAAAVNVEWDDLIRDLDRLQEATIEKDGKRITTRTHVEGQVGKVFQAVGIALPPNWREHKA